MKQSTSISQIGITCQREVTLKHAIELHKAMKGDEEAQKVVQVGELEGLQFRHGFPYFVEANRSRLAIIEKGVR